MVNVNKKYLDEKIKKEAWIRFRNELGSNKSETKFLKVIDRWLTSAEITMVEKRLGIRCLLEKNLSYREIGRILDVTPNTISFIKKEFKKAPRVSRKYTPWKDSSKKKSRPILPPRGRGRWDFLNSY